MKFKTGDYHKVSAAQFFLGNWITQTGDVDKNTFNVFKDLYITLKDGAMMLMSKFTLDDIYKNNQISYGNSFKLWRKSHKNIYRSVSANIKFIREEIEAIRNSDDETLKVNLPIWQMIHSAMIVVARDMNTMFDEVYRQHGRFKKLTVDNYKI